MIALWCALAAVGGGSVGAALTVMRLPQIVARMSKEQRLAFAKQVTAIANDG